MNPPEAEVGVEKMNKCRNRYRADFVASALRDANAHFYAVRDRIRQNNGIASQSDDDR
jgi:hypothetical protein